MERWLLYYLSNGGAIKSPCKWPMPHFILIYGILIEFVSVNWKILLFNVCIAVAYQPVFNETVSLWPWGGGEGIALDWQGWGLGVKVFRVHEGKDGPQRLGLISTVNTEKGCIPFNYVGAKWCTHDQRLYKHGDTFIDQQSHWIIHDLIPLTKITLTISLWCFLCLFIHGFSNII